MATTAKPKASKTLKTIKPDVKPTGLLVSPSDIFVPWEMNPRMPKGLTRDKAYEITVGEKGKNIATIRRSIPKHGLLHPISVVETNGPNGEKYEVYDGFTRMAALLSLKEKEIPIRIYKGKLNRNSVALTANSPDCRINMNPAIVAERIMEEVASAGKNPDKAEIAAALGYSVASVERLLVLGSAPDHIKHLVREFNWSVEAAFALKVTGDGEITWDSKELVNAVLEKVGKNTKPSGSEVKAARQKVLAENDTEPDDEEPGTEAGSKLDENEEASAPPPLQKKGVEDASVRLSRLYLFAGDEAESHDIDWNVTLLKGDPTQRMAFFAGILYGLNRARKGKVEDILDSSVGDKRRYHSARKAVQLDVLQAVWSTSKIDSDDRVDPKEYERLQNLWYELGATTKGDFSEKVKTLRSEIDKMFKKLNKLVPAKKGEVIPPKVENKSKKVVDEDDSDE